MSIFDKWNKDFGGEETIEQVREANGTGNYEEVPHGDYEVKIDKMELKASKKGDPMLSVWFKILDGKFKNSYIFMNQVCNRPFQIHIILEFIRSLGFEIDWDGDYQHFADSIADVFEESADLEMHLAYSQNTKGFNTFEIVEVFE